MNKTAKLLESNHQRIIDDWEAIVLREVPAANSANEIALHDHIPNILDDIIDILYRHDHIDYDFDDPKIAQIEKNSIDHGRHRASSSQYTVDQILHEYMIFQNVITNIMRANDITDGAVQHLFKCCIDKAMLNSVASFSESIQEMQNKLIGTLAHDIRNPLAAARMAIEMLEHEAGKDRLKKVKKMTWNSLNKSIQLVEGLLDSIKVRAGEGIMLTFEEVDLYEDIQTVHAEACEVYTEEIILNCVDEGLDGVYDATAIRRLLENLISNAVKYGYSDKPITVSIESENTSHLLIKVHNYGEPIPQEKQKDIFSFLEYGNQNKNKQYQSYGIGLTLVKMVAEAHGGKVELKSSKEEGTEFSVVIKKHAMEPGKVRTQITASA